MNYYRYTNVEFVAEGGFARVYRAFDMWTRQIVAIKQLKNPTPDSLERLRREKELLEIHRNNPHVVNILDSCLEGPNPYLVLEYSSLGSMQKYVANRRNWRRVAGWLRDICYGLTMIHERGDLVRDIKPSNLLKFTRADGSEIVKIADFGLGQRSDNPSGQMTTSVFGTEGYIDPVAKVSQRFTAASDIYSLGVTMKELLSGSRYFWPFFFGPVELRSLINSMTDANVSNRPTARQVFERVDRILRAAPVPAAQQSGNGLGWVLAGAALIVGAFILADASRA